MKKPTNKFLISGWTSKNSATLELTPGAYDVALQAISIYGR